MMITSRQAAGGEGPLLEAVRRAAATGVEYIQVREKDLEPRALASLTRAIQTAAAGSRVLVNGRPDVALACNAHGFHLPGGAPPPSLWRGVVPGGYTISVACHTIEDALRAQAEGADLIVFAPVFDAISKPAAGAPAGLDVLRDVCRAVRLPVLALGGVTEERIPLCRAAGAAGFAAISYFL